MHSAATKRKRTDSSDNNSIQTENQLLIPSTAAECFSKILDDQGFCDVTFLVGPLKEEIRAHKIFLKARSAMLRENFSGKWEDRDTVELTQFDPKAFKSFLKFVYTDQVDLEDTDWMKVLEVAHFFLVQPLVDICAEAGLRDARSDIGQALEAFQTLRLYGQRKAMDQIGESMANSFIKLSNTETFIEQVDDDTLCYLLQLDHLRVNDCKLFKIVRRVAEARARSRVSEGDEVPQTAVASEIAKFIPLIRFPTMTLNKFRTVVDDSRLMPPEMVLDLYRFFTAIYPWEKQAIIASNWPYNNAERRCKEFVKFYETPSPSAPEVRRQIFLDDLQQKDCLRFYSKVIDLDKSESKRMPSCGSKGFVITGVGIQCPALFNNATTEATEIYFNCHIEIQASDSRSLNSPSGRGIPKIQMTCPMKPNDFTEVAINPPLPLPSGLGKGVRITAEVTFGPGKEKKSGQKCILLQYPEEVLTPRAEAEFCSHKIQLTELLNERPRGYMIAKNWQMIRGIRVQAL